MLPGRLWSTETGEPWLLFAAAETAWESSSRDEVVTNSKSNARGRLGEEEEQKLEVENEEAEQNIKDAVASGEWRKKASGRPGP